jgi:hypothetical protein
MMVAEVIIVLILTLASMLILGIGCTIIHFILRAYVEEAVKTILNNERK